MIEFPHYFKDGLREADKIRNSKLELLAQNIVFAVLSLAVAFFTRIPIIPSLPFLKLDLSDTPVLIATLISGVPAGVSVLFTVCTLRLMFFSAAGFAGLVIRLTSLVLIFTMGFLTEKNSSNRENISDSGQKRESLPSPIFLYFSAKNIIFLVAGILICTLIKIPLNYLFWIYFFGLPKNFIVDMLIPFILPFNIVKATINCILALILKPFAQKIIDKI